MSRPYKPSMIIRCPLCSVGSRPAHVGHGVMVCENCGNYFRVVMARGKNTGANLAKVISETVKWGEQ